MTDDRIHQKPHTAGTPRAGGPEADRAASYRGHFDRNLSAVGSYEDFETAYAYGSSLRDDPRYTGRAWADSATDAQKGWVEQNPDGTWERVMAAVRHGWEWATDYRK